VPVPARINFVTLAVSDLARSRAFYAALGWKPSGPAGAGAEEVAFYDLNGVIFALYRREHFFRDMHLPLPNAAPAPEVAHAINVETPEAVPEVPDEVRAAGGSILAPAEQMAWGGTAGYFADPDGHAWEVAFNPGMPLDESGRVQIP